MPFKIPSIPASAINQKSIEYGNLPCFTYSEFRNFEEIGRGAFGAVFAAEDANGNKVVVKKLLNDDQHNQFMKETRILLSIKHENVVEASASVH